MLKLAVPLVMAAAVTAVLATLELRLAEYFSPPSFPVLERPPGAYFRTYHEKDLSDDFGFFLLPAQDEQIGGTDAFALRRCGGNGIFSLSSILSTQLSNILASISGEEQKDRLGLFKLFPNRISSKPLDAYLHFIDDGARLKFAVKEKDALARVFHDLVLFLSDAHRWSKHLAGITVLQSSELHFEVWLGPDMTAGLISELQAQITALPLWEAVSRSEITWDVVCGHKIEKISKIRAEFLSPNPEIDLPADPTPLNAEWAMLSTKLFQLDSQKSQDSNGSYEGRLLARNGSIVSQAGALDYVFRTRASGFPGALAKNNCMGLFKTSFFPPEAIPDHLTSAKPLMVTYRSHQHDAFKVPLTGLTQYHHYYTAARLALKWLATSTVPEIVEQIDGALVHLVGAPTPADCQLEIEFFQKHPKEAEGDYAPEKKRKGGAKNRRQPKGDERVRNAVRQHLGVYLEDNFRVL